MDAVTNSIPPNASQPGSEVVWGSVGDWGRGVLEAAVSGTGAFNSATTRLLQATLTLVSCESHRIHARV